MKQCPNCKHEVREDTGICPYCGYQFPQKRVIRLSIPIIPLLLTVMFLIPLGMSLLFAPLGNTTSNGTLASGSTLKEVDSKSTSIEWMTFNSYATFSNYFTNGEEAMNRVLSFEKGLEDFMILQGYSYKKEEKVILYSNYVVETTTVYTIKNENQEMILNYKEDNLDQEALTLIHTQHAFDFEGLKITDEALNVFSSIYTYLENKEFTSTPQFVNLISSLEADFNKYEGRISHYGLNAKEDSMKVKITFDDEYTCNYEYKIK